MARQQQVTTVYSDDLTGEELTGEAVETIEFALDGVSYEIDLSAANASALRDDLGKWVGHARKSAAGPRATGRRRSGGSSAPATGDREQNSAIRDWARRNGHTISDRGRIPSAVVEAYHQVS